MSPACGFFLSQEQNLGNNTLHNAMSSPFETFLANLKRLDASSLMDVFTTVSHVIS